jgi:N-methylhydantoinase A
MLGVDVGGTFTDACWWDGVRLTVAKVSSTPDQSDGVIDAASALSGGTTPSGFVHGTTVATNALLERRGARTALVCDDGLDDVIEIGRQDRPSLYDPFADRPEPLVPARRRFGLAGRAGASGGAIPAADEVDRIVRAVAESGAEAAAVSLLYAFLDDSRERAVADALGRLGIPVSRSSAVANEFREFERASTTVVNAFLTPEMDRYLAHLDDRVASAGLGDAVLVMRSSGGPMTLAAARALPVAALLSGPAGGVVASAALGAVLGDTRLISFDMGGTSTDVCRIDGGDPEVGYERVIDGLPVRVPTVAIHTVGAGGGSIGWADTGGALRVGPRSAGATPGPAAYGRGGGEPAVTDANLVLGRIPGDARLAGRVALDVGLSRAALARLGEAVGLDVVGVATGMIEVVEAHMERAVRAVSVEEGADPRPARLVAFGGAGGLHATALARRLEMRGVVVPPHAGVFSALGLLLAPPRHDTARSVLLDDADATGLDRAVRAVMDDARDGLAALGGSAEVVEAFVDVRYRGQAHETTVPYRPAEGWTALEDRFHDRHHDRNGFARRGDPIEVVTVRAVASAEPALRWGDLPEHRPQGTRDLGERSVVFDGVARSVRFFDRAALGPGDEVVGPAVVVEGEATTLLHPGDRATVHPTGALEVEW